MSTAISVCHGQFGRAALYRLDKSLVTHAHRESHLIFHFSGSHSKVAIHDQDYVVNDHDAVAVNPLEPHSFRIDTPQASGVLVLYIKSTWMSKYGQSDEFALRFGDNQIDRTSAINDLVHKLTSLLLRTGSTSSIDTLLFLLVKDCYEQTWQRTKMLCSVKSKSSGCSDPRIHRSLRLMQRSISAEVELEAVARAVGLSRPHFFKLFKKQLGVTPNVYMNTLRSERAIDELINTEKTVTNIASDLGYSSQASFTRFFATNVGIAPSEYRRAIDTGNEITR